MIKGLSEQVRDEGQLAEDALQHAAEALVTEGFTEQGRDDGQRSEVDLRTRTAAVADRQISVRLFSWLVGHFQRGLRLGIADSGGGET